MQYYMYVSHENNNNNIEIRHLNKVHVEVFELEHLRLSKCVITFKSRKRN